jgi:O-antigen/teichoic acid export membrane protein
MKDLHRVTKGVFLKTISNLMVVLLGLVTSVLLNRYFGKQNYGLLILVYTVINFCWSFSNLGATRTINRLVPKMISERKAAELNSLLKTALGFQIFGILTFALAMYFSAHFIAVSLFHKSQLVLLIKVGAIMLMGTSTIEFVSQFYQAFQDWLRDSLLNIIYPVLYLILIIIGIFFFNMSVSDVLYANALAAGFTVFLAVIVIPANIKSLMTAEHIKLNDYLISSKKILTFGTPLLFENLSFFLVTWFDKALLGRFRPLEELTFYYVALTFLNGMVVLFKTLVTVFMPYLSNISNAGEEIIKDRFELMFRWFIHITVFVSLVAFFLIEPVIFKLYGKDYQPAVLAFRMLLLLFISRSLANLPNIFLTNVYGRAKQTVGIIAILVVANVALNSAIVPQYGFKGAILAAILAYGIYWISMGWVKAIRDKVPFITIFKTMGIIMIVFLLYYPLQKIGIRTPYFYSVFLPLVYLLLLKLVKEINKRDIRITQEIFNRLLLRNKVNEPQII